MIKRALFRDLDVNVMNLGKVLEEVRRKEITGFLRIVYWSKDEYLMFNRGTPYLGVSFEMGGGRKTFQPTEFRIDKREGTASLFESTVDDLVGIIESRHDLSHHGSLVLFPYGTVVQEPVSVSFLDINREFLLAQRSHLNGYVALYTEDTLFGMVVFQEGFPVAVFGGDGSFGDRAVTYINANLIPARSYMSMYSLEPELLSFVYSTHSDNVIEIEANFSTYEEAKSFVSEGRRNAIVVVEAEGMFRFDMFFRGQHIDRLVKDKGVFITSPEDEERLSTKIENLPDRSVFLYELHIEDNPRRMSIVIENTWKDSLEVEENVDIQFIDEIKRNFIRCLGPVGRLLWNMILTDLGLDESSINRNQLRILVERLRREIPEEVLAREFTTKVNILLQDIL